MMTDCVVFVLCRNGVFLVLRYVELSDLLLDIVIERSLPELQVTPDRMLLNTCVGKLDHPGAQFLQCKYKKISHSL